MGVIRKNAVITDVSEESIASMIRMKKPAM
jgi:hypothetical protein